jgi:hypothetical protein
MPNHNSLGVGMTSVTGTDDGGGFGVKGIATGGDGVVGTTRGIHKVAIRGIHTGHISAIAIRGELGQGTAAVQGQVGGGTAVGGDEVIGSGVWGDSGLGPGISGTSSAAEGVLGEGTIGVHGIARNGGTLAGLFNGDVEVTGDLILTGADVAEQFDVADVAGDTTDIGPGSVVVLDDTGALMACVTPYDTRVAGVISGAGDREPALVLDRRTSLGSDSALRESVALVGKAWTRADATCQPIRVGDLLTTSSTAGHAMAAINREAAFGAVLGKALSPLASGTGWVLVLVGLR